MRLPETPDMGFSGISPKPNGLTDPPKVMQPQTRAIVAAAFPEQASGPLRREVPPVTSACHGQQP